MNNYLVKVINPVETGVSKATGNVFKVQEIVLEWQVMNSAGYWIYQRVCGTLFNDNVDRFAAIEPVAGQTMIEAELSFSTRALPSGKVINEVIVKL